MQENVQLGGRAIRCEMIFKRNLDENSNITRYKARLIAKRYVQKQGTQFDETINPVLQLALIILAAGIHISVKDVICTMQLGLPLF